MDIKEILWQAFQYAVGSIADELVEQAYQMIYTPVGDPRRGDEDSYARFTEYGMPPVTVIEGSAVIIDEAIPLLPAPQQEP